MNCACHDVPMLWTKDKRYTAGGFWRCRISHRAKCRAHYAETAKERCASVRDYYHDRGWAVVRRRKLRGQRADILERLAQLEQEAVTLVE